jgi:RNA polymerase sigma-70 factor (ECF subfamily)
MAMEPSPVVALNRSVAVAEADGADAALVLVDELPLEGFHVFHAIRAELLSRLGRDDEADEEYERAIRSAANEPERVLLERKREASLGL